MRAQGLGAALVLVALAAGAVTSTRVCGKVGIPPIELTVYPPLDGTLCDVIAKAPAAHPRGPLPDDPALAAWTANVEGALEEALALDAIGHAHGGRRNVAPSDQDLACARKLVGVVGRLPRDERLRALADTGAGLLLRSEAASSEREKLVAAISLVPEAGSPALPAVSPPSKPTDCTAAPSFLATYPQNSRLRRALIMQFQPCLYDNYSSIDGDLDRTEIFMRETVSSWPERTALDYELLVAADWTSQDPALMTWVWLRAPFARITLDLGASGNALRVMRDLRQQRPEVVRELLPVARKRAAMAVPSHRRARWTALVAYLEADAPNPGDHPEAALARALRGDERSARWALGYLPNELMENAPRPFPYLRDPAVIEATVARAELVTTDEDRILVLDVLSQMPPGTALPRIVAWASSPNESVWRAAVAAMEKHIGQLPIKAEPGELEAGAERRAHTAKLLAPHLAALRAGLATHVCAAPEAITFLADANDPGIDDEVLPCVDGKPQPDTGFLTTLFHSCLDHHDLGFAKTGAALAKTAQPGDNGHYARRVSKGCVTGQD